MPGQGRRLIARLLAGAQTIGHEVGRKPSTALPWRGQRLQLGRIRAELPVREPLDQPPLEGSRVRRRCSIRSGSRPEHRAAKQPRLIDHGPDRVDRYRVQLEAVVSARPGRATSSRNSSWYEQFSSKK